MSIEEYRELCNKVDITLFSKDWWFDAIVGKDNWDAAIYQEDGITLGAFPYAIQNFWKIYKGIFNPPCSHRTELYISDKIDLRNKDYYHNIISDIITKIPQKSLFKINFHYQLTDWQSFYWNKYKQTTKYSYLIHNTNKLDEVYSGFHTRIKKCIIQANKAFRIIESEDIELFYNSISKFLNEKSIRFNLSKKQLFSIDSMCKENQCRKILFSINDKEEVCACTYLVWDHKYLYYLLCGTSINHKKFGLASQLVWESIKIASKLNKIFDFEGSMIKSVANFYKGFNATTTPYLNIYKYNNIILKLLLD